ncbi:MAG TPA: hypothetical protein VFF04_06375 [Candidatus Babeliales bacterium]|nr:hypothetical protein [Candidatus Babeliales bacterium]
MVKVALSIMLLTVAINAADIAKPVQESSAEARARLALIVRYGFEALPRDVWSVVRDYLALSTQIIIKNSPENIQKLSWVTPAQSDHCNLGISWTNGFTAAKTIVYLSPASVTQTNQDQTLKGATFVTDKTIFFRSKFPTQIVCKAVNPKTILQETSLDGCYHATLLNVTKETPTKSSAAKKILMVEHKPDHATCLLLDKAFNEFKSLE